MNVAASETFISTMVDRIVKGFQLRGSSSSDLMHEAQRPNGVTWRSLHLD